MSRSPQGEAVGSLMAIFPLTPNVPSGKLVPIPTALGRKDVESPRLVAGTPVGVKMICAFAKKAKEEKRIAKNTILLRFKAFGVWRLAFGVWRL